MDRPEREPNDETPAGGTWMTRATGAFIALCAVATVVLIVRFPDLRAGGGPRAMHVWFFTGTIAAVLALRMAIVAQWPDIDRRYASPWLRGSPSSNLAVLLIVIAYAAGVLLEHLH